jgi:hypothetical protein
LDSMKVILVGVEGGVAVVSCMSFSFNSSNMESLETGGDSVPVRFFKIPSALD